MPQISLRAAICLASLLVGCRSKNDPKDASNAWIPPDQRPPRVEMAPETLQARLPGAGEVLRRNGIGFRGVRILPTSPDPVLALELPADAFRHDWERFQKFVVELGEAAKWEEDVGLWDSAHRFLIQVSLQGLGQGRGGIRIHDTAGFFAPPAFRNFGRGIDRVQVSLEEAGIVYRDPDEPVPSEGMLQGSDCAGLKEINGGLYYRLQMWETPITNGSPEGMTHTTGWFLVDAATGQRWTEDMVYEGSPFRGKKSKLRILRQVADSSNRGWRLLEGKCDDQESAKIWQYHSGHRRIQSILLSSKSVSTEVGLDDLGIPGDLVDLMDPLLHDSLSRTYLVLRQARTVRIYRSSDSRLFDQEWTGTLPDTGTLARSISLVELPDGSVRIKAGSQATSAKASSWETLPGQVSIPAESVANPPQGDTATP